MATRNTLCHKRILLCSSSVVLSIFVFTQFCIIWHIVHERNNGKGRMDGYSKLHDESGTLGLTSASIVKENETTTVNKDAATIKPVVTTSKPSSSTNTNIVDMVNGYHPFVDFHFVWPDTEPELGGRRDFFIVILVNSAARGDKYRARRNAIRQTWGNVNVTKCRRSQAIGVPNAEKHSWLLVFSLGKVGNESGDNANVAEAEQNNDLLIGDFTDHYLNNVVKIFMGQLWVSSMNVQYILKTDDDVYVRVPQVVDWLVAQRTPTWYYGGAPYHHFIVDRNPSGKWAVSWKYFNEKYFPSFCAGAFYVLSTDILKKLFNYVRTRKPFHTDDAYIGIAARDLNITISRISGFLLEDNMPAGLPSFSNCKILNAKAFGHSIEPALMHKLHNRLTGLCTSKIKC